MNRTILIAACVFAISSCAPSRYVRPLEEGQKAITGNLGGPLIKFSGMTIPLPLTAISLGYGLKDNLTIYGGVHTTALSFGVIQGDFGVVKEFINLTQCLNLNLALVCLILLIYWSILGKRISNFGHK